MEERSEVMRRSFVAPPSWRRFRAASYDHCAEAGKMRSKEHHERDRRSVRSVSPDNGKSKERACCDRIILPHLSQSDAARRLHSEDSGLLMRIVSARGVRYQPTDRNDQMLLTPRPPPCALRKFPPRARAPALYSVS